VNPDDLIAKWKESYPAVADFNKKVAAQMIQREVEYLRMEKENLEKPWNKPGWSEEEPSIVDRVAGLDDRIAAQRCQDWDDWVKAGKPRPPRFPGISRSTPGMIANDIVSVQPMTGPVGGIAFYKPRYGSKTGKV
jgi:hypothetical protein